MVLMKKAGMERGVCVSYLCRTKDILSFYATIALDKGLLRQPKSKEIIMLNLNPLARRGI